MKQLFVLTYLIVSFSWSFSQSESSYKIYDWEVAKNANPDTIFAISFVRLKLETIPADLKNFTQVKRLDFKKNKISSLPSYFADFDSLEVLSLERNKLEAFPVVLCRLSHLKELNVGWNSIEFIPDCIGGLVDLELLELFDNPVRNLPESLNDLKQLRKVDLSGIRFSPAFQSSWKAQLPQIEFLFDAPCDCME